MYRVALPDDLEGAREGAPWTNRLIHETSPYLLQHAHNPVDWHPWGDQAFEKARGEDKPILLSIGYAACHWCHVMEHESFSDPRVSAFLNTRFVPIKVDREERPDVDALYIEALLAFLGQAGWPANLFLMPDLRPFTGVTYLPPNPRYGMPSFENMLHHVAELWERDRDRLEASAGAVTRAVAQVLPASNAAVDLDGYRGAVGAVVAGQDPQHAGHGTGQKFPQAALVELMLLGTADGDPGAARAVSTMLRAMASGGLRDHLGGGFHRYCVDRAWTVPHFEKMLYDNAQLLRVYARAASLFAHEDPALSRLCVRAARDTVRYLWTDLRTEGGAFQASEDADDPRGEGFFYTFTPEEALAVLGSGADLPYGIDEQGNFEHGRTVLSTWSGTPPEPVRQALLEARNHRARPALDHKRVVAWNGLASGALAEAGRLLGFDDWIDDAARCAEAVLAVQHDDGLFPRLFEGGAPGILDDQVMVAGALLDLYQARPAEPRWLDTAAALVEATLAAFAGPDGALYQSRPRPDLIKRRIDFQDGAEPSANGRMSWVLARLVALGAMERTRLDALVHAGSGLMVRAPQAAAELWGTVRALAGDGPWELVVAGAADDPVVVQMLRVWNQRWRPQGIVVLLTPGSDLAERYGLLRGKAAQTATAYACRHGVCRLPVGSAEELEQVLSS